jgi:SAM-dependent methyltransferase
MRSQAARGQDYYLHRLDCLNFTGGSVLDAGCGVGNWAIALARRFATVAAIDDDAERIGVLTGLAQHFGERIKPLVGSVTKLPYDDATFDAVFCNGVIFLTDTHAALAEFARVLRPSGLLYVTYNGPEWWRHLIRDRAASEPVCYMYGANGLITWAFRLTGELDLFRRSSAVERDAVRAALGAGDTSVLLAALRPILVRLGKEPGYARPGADLIACLDDLAAPGIDPAYSSRLAADIASRITTGDPKSEILIHTYTHRPEDISSDLSRLGFIDILSAREGGLALNVDAPRVAPIYAPNQGVFETLATKS